jgi:hypothetical protein
MGREVVLIAKLEAPVDAISLGTIIELAGHKFSLTEVKPHFEAPSEKGTFDVEGSRWLSYVEPQKLIAKVRKELAQKRA